MLSLPRTRLGYFILLWVISYIGRGRGCTEYHACCNAETAIIVRPRTRLVLSAPRTRPVKAYISHYTEVCLAAYAANRVLRDSRVRGHVLLTYPL